MAFSGNFFCNGTSAEEVGTRFQAILGEAAIIANVDYYEEDAACSVDFFADGETAKEVGERVQAALGDMGVVAHVESEYLFDEEDGREAGQDDGNETHLWEQ